MQHTVILVAGGTIAFIVLRMLWSLRQNIAIAKKTGLNYVIAPCWASNIVWQTFHSVLTPLIRRLPQAFWDPWLDITHPDFAYIQGHAPFAKFGDVFLLVSPGGVLVLVASAEVTKQMTTRREDFPKDVGIYGLLSQFGHNVVTTEGMAWRMHRKVTSASFNEKNTALVFREAISQAQGMVQTWTGSPESGSGILRAMEEDTMKLALHVIGYVGFGLRLLWPGQSLPRDADPRIAKYTSLKAGSGHTFNFVDTMSLLLEHIVLLLIFPKWLLRLVPKKAAQDAVASRNDYVRYMDEMMDDKLDQAQSGEHTREGMDLMGQLVRSSYGLTSEKDGGKPGTLTREEIVGNAFIMFLAGHETSANTIHFALLELAANPATQRRLQKDIDEMVGDSDPSTWDYDQLVNPMMASLLGACLNETLRLMPSVTNIPKMVSPTKDQVITMDGAKYVIPKGTVAWLVAGSVQRNPRYWPTQPSKITPRHDDIDDWAPERWYRKLNAAGNGSSPQQEEEDEYEAGEDFGGYRGADTSAQLFRPERGAYIPFSDGPRGCLGRRIAQVEIIAALAVLFQRYSLELVPEEEGEDGKTKEVDVEGLGREERARLFVQAQARARETIAGARSVVTLKLRDGNHVPVRLVPRGQEKFVSWYEE